MKGVCSRISYCKVHDYLKSKTNNSSLKWMKIGDVVLTPTTVGINTILGQKDSTLQQNH